MTKTQHLTRTAGVAIAAALAFGSTPSLAQDATDTVTAPEVAIPQTPPPIVQPAPTVAVPVEVTPPAAETVQPLPAPSASPTTTARVATTSTSTKTPTPVRRATVTPAPVVASPEPVASADPVIAPAAVAVPVAERVTPTVAEPAGTPVRENSTAMLATILGALIVLGLAIWGFVAIGRRKRPDEALAVPVVERPVVDEPAPAPLATAPVAPAPLVPATAGGLAHAGASVSLPRTMPETFEERDALLKRMIAAKPDRANPFTDRKARTYRARLILQSLGRDFGDTKPWIDLSQYPNNWPELARNQSVAA